MFVVITEAIINLIMRCNEIKITKKGRREKYVLSPFLDNKDCASRDMYHVSLAAENSFPEG